MTILYLGAFVALGTMFGAALAMVYQLPRLQLWRDQADRMARQLEEAETRITELQIANARLRHKLTSHGCVKP